jgi:hypothetical protein
VISATNGPKRVETLSERISGLSVESDDDFPIADLGHGLAAQVVLVTPDLARSWLERLYEGQRNVRPYHLKAIVRDIQEGRWRFTAEPIIFSASDELIDGQHRLFACIEANRSILSLVVWGVPDESYHAIDSSAKRTGGDALRSAAVEYPKDVASAVPFVAKWEQGVSLKLSYSMSASEIAEIAERHPGLSESAGRVRLVARLYGHRSIPTFCHYVFSRVDPAAADDFFYRLGTLENLPKHHPILALHRRLSTGGKPSREEALHLTYKAWVAYRKGRDVQVLKVHPSEDLPEII